jgi:hypothetical protein
MPEEHASLKSGLRAAHGACFLICCTLCYIVCRISGSVSLILFGWGGCLSLPGAAEASRFRQGGVVGDNGSEPTQTLSSSHYWFKRIR